MKKQLSLTRLSILTFLSGVLLLSSCVQGTGKRSSKASATSGLTGGSKGSSNAIGDSSDSDSTDVISQQVELSHLVDPFDGTYKKKLTIPKNFKGNLYLAGLNIASLANKLVSVRFYFGTDKQPVTLSATIARAPGIVPKTDIQVLVVDMNSRPFKNMRLGYDLYDYTDYSSTTTIASDPRDGALYCRGLRLADDPTFSSTATSCSDANAKCLYSYAKVTDTTLYKDQVVNGTTYRLSSIPTKPQIWTESGGVRNPLVSSVLGTVCLPDDPSKTSMNNFFDINLASLGTADVPVLGYYYRGPFRSINDSEWQISGDAIYGATNGLFQTRSSNASAITGYHSLLFPRAGTASLSAGVNYLGATTIAGNLDDVNVIGPRQKFITDSTGVTNTMDGCNLRAMNYDPSNSESIGSCNVDSSIEVFYMSSEGKEVIITTDKSIKLQLIRASLTNSEAKEVLTTSFKTCDSSSTCGSSECCFNSRCWSKDLVTQCVDTAPVVGNYGIGANCSSDYECSSLCCNQATGSCAPHDPSGATPVLCSKPAGQACVSKEFCQQVAIPVCKLYKTGTGTDGAVTCAVRCPVVMTYGNCTSGACVAPVVPAYPTDTDCSKAIDP